MSFNILGIDSSTKNCSVALLTDGEVIEKSIATKAHNSENMLHMIEQVLAEGKVQPASLDLLCFGAGPGSFTGIRIASGVMQGLAFGWNKSVCRISALHTMAVAAFRQLGARKVVVLLDARKDEVYFGKYALDTTTGFMMAECPDSLIDPAQVVVEDAIVIGQGAKVYHDCLLDNNPNMQINADICYPMAANVIKIADFYHKQGRISEVIGTSPFYLRKKVV